MALRIIVPVLGISALMVQVAASDEIRKTKFAGALLGTWAPSQELCERKDKSSVTILETQFTSSDRNCEVQWIIERAASLGAPYGIHARCFDRSDPEKVSAINLIVWPQGSDQISIGKTFDDLKVYQRCLAK
jgi:hypothetical protein